MLIFSVQKNSFEGDSIQDGRGFGAAGLGAYLEPKGDPRFLQEWTWDYIFAVAEDAGCTIAIRALPQNAAALAVARRVAARSGQHVEAWEI